MWSDGLVLIDVSTVADFSMRVFSADSSEVLMCDNAAIRVGKHICDRKLSDKAAFTLETMSGVKDLKLHMTDNVMETVTVSVGLPTIRDLNIDFSCDAAVHVVGAAISIGNPHFVINVDGVIVVDLQRGGPLLEHPPLFSNRANIELARACGDAAIQMRVWQRF
jgi:diaminopimelate epimerase